MGVTLDGDTGCVYNLEERNLAAQACIGKWANRHRIADVGIGLSGLLPVPGAATAALIGAIAVQGPLIYSPMSKELATIYRAEVDDHTRQLIIDTIEEGAKLDLAIDLGVEFMKEIAADIILELAGGVALTAIPFIGAVAAAVLDAMVAATLTWRVGTMVSAYFQNGEAWVIDRKNTYHIAAKQIGGYSAKVESRTDLNDLSKNNQAIREKQVADVTKYVKMMQRGNVSFDQIRRSLLGERVPPWVMDIVLNRAFSL